MGATRTGELCQESERLATGGVAEAGTVAVRLEPEYAQVEVAWCGATGRSSLTGPASGTSANCWFRTPGA